MNIGPYCHFAQRDGVRAVFRHALSNYELQSALTSCVTCCTCVITKLTLPVAAVVRSASGRAWT